MKVWHKLALILIITTSLSISTSVILFQYHFKKSFLDYLHQQEQRRIELIADNLLMQYKDSGNWDFIRDNRRLWARYINSRPVNKPVDKRFNQRNDDEPGNPPPFRDRKIEFLGKHRPMGLSLLDSNYQLIVGKKRNNQNLLINSPIEFDGKVIAYIQGLKPNKITDHLDQLFATKQYQSFVTNALIAIIISILVALIVAWYVNKRISALTLIAQQLTSGLYDKRIEVKQHDELGQLGADFNSLATTLEKNQQAQKQWIADISHELRTPVAILKGELEALDDGIRPLNLDAIASLKQETERLNKLIDDLYQLSVSDMGALRYKKELFNFCDFLAEIEENFAEIFVQNNLRLSFENKVSKKLVYQGDRARLYQLVSNLLNNSQRYTDAGGEVCLKCFNNKESIILSLEDSAPGIDEKNLSLIFERLFRVENSRTRLNGGAGLGLAIAKQIVQAHQGEIIAKNSPLGGVLILLTLPIKL